MKHLHRTWIITVLPLIWQACDKAPMVDTETTPPVQIGYSLTEAPQSRATGDVLEAFPDETIFRFIGYVKGGRTEPSLTDHTNDPDHASPYGYYRFTSKQADATGKDTITFEPCSIDANMKYIARDHASAQRLTGILYFDATYEILAYTPPRPTYVPSGGATIIPYKRGEDLYLTDNRFDIVIPRREGKVYQIYNVPTPWTFHNMKSLLTFAFYEKDVPFTLDSEITMYGLGTDAYLHPYTKDLKIFYRIPQPGDTDADKDTDNHLTDPFAVVTESGEATPEKTLRYSVPPIAIFPADYSSTTVKHPIKVNIRIKYANQPDAAFEAMEIRLPVNALPSHNYQISFIISRTNVEVRAHVINKWQGSEISPIPLEIGGAGGGILLGNWNVDSEWGNVDLPGEDL